MQSYENACGFGTRPNLIYETCQLRDSERRIPSIAYASASVTAVNQLVNVLMFDELATVGGSDAARHFPNKPLIVVHQALYRLLHKGSRIAS